MVTSFSFYAHKYIKPYRIFKDHTSYYIYFSSSRVKDGNYVSFKMSVISRFVSLLIKNGFILLLFLIDIFIKSFSASFISLGITSMVTIKKRLKFHGLAFGIDFTEDTKEAISLNVGFSEPPIFSVPKWVTCVRLSKNKRKVVFASDSYNAITNLVVQLRNVRPISPYYNPAKRGGRRGIRLYLSFIPRKKIKKDGRR